MDRSPTGSGVTARIAVQYAKKLIELNQERIFENGAVHSKFTGKVSKGILFLFPFLVSYDFLDDKSWQKTHNGTT